MSGQEAVKQLLDEASREEFVAVKLVARALRQDSRRILRDWKKRNLPITRIGRETLLHGPLVLATYFPHASPAAAHQSRHSNHRPADSRV